MITIGTLQLDPEPYVDINYNYSTTGNQKVFGGTKTITLSGSVVRSTPSELIDQVKKIQNWYVNNANRTYQNITIKGQTYSSIRVLNLSIDSSDWVNKAQYTIELETNIETILNTNDFDLIYDDLVESLDISESLEINADNNHTFYFGNDGLQTIAGSLKWNINISISCKRSHRQTAIKNAELALRKIFSKLSAPTRLEFNPYRNWKKYLQSRSLTSNSSKGSLTFSNSVVMLPPDIKHDCLINLENNFSHNYMNNSHTKKVSINFDGLVPIEWDAIIDVQSTCAHSKINSVNNLISSFISAYKNESVIDDTSDVYLIALNCANYCGVSQNICFTPTSFSVNRSITDGRATLDLEWSSDPSRCSNNGIVVEIEKTLATVTWTIIPHRGWSMYYPVVQDLKCQAPTIATYTTTATSIYKCLNTNTQAVAYANSPTYVDEAGTWTLVRWTTSQNNNSYTITKEFVRVCP